MDQTELRKAAAAFGKNMDFHPVGNGHINDTYLSEDGNWILQRINTYVFTDPAAVMENIEAVTAHIRRKLVAENGDFLRGTLQIEPALDGGLYAAVGDSAYRMYDNISGTHSVEPVERTMAQFEEAARAFGEFQRMMADFPAERLHETIPDFHNTVKRLEKLKNVVRSLSDAEKAGEQRDFERLHEARPYIEYVLSQEELASAVLHGLADGSIPLAVTHNDTKINNVLFDDATGKAVAVIDLDTVMPGSRLYDFGDAVRSGAVTAAEDEPDGSKMHFDAEAYQAFKRGYLSEMAEVLTEAEEALLFTSARLITYECGIRFLTDYLENDVYFKTAYPGHNLVRARNQFALLREMSRLPADF